MFLIIRFCTPVFWQDFAVILFAISILLLLAVLVIGDDRSGVLLGAEHSGCARGGYNAVRHEGRRFSLAEAGAVPTRPPSVSTDKRRF